MSKQSIIDKILDDANELAAKITAQANEEAQEIVQKAQQGIDSRRAKAQHDAQTYAQNAQKRQLAMSQLELKKYNLSLRQQVIARVFDQAQQDIAKLSTEKYQKFVAKLLKTHAQKGETVIVGDADRKRLTKEFFASVNDKLVVSDSKAGFDYGIVLSTDSYDKDLTLASLVAGVRDRITKQVSDLLFTEK